MGTLNGISYYEPLGSFTGNISRDSASFQRIFDVAWSDKMGFMVAALGGVEDFAGGTVATPPMLLEPGSPYVAVGASIEGLGKLSLDGSGIAAYEKARITVEYGPPAGFTPFEEDPEQEAAVWAEEDSQFKTETLIIPGHSVRWADTGEQLDEPTGITVVISDISLTRYNVAVLNRPALIWACGTINSKSFLDYPAKTLLFLGFSPRRTINVLGVSSKYTVTIGLKFKPTGWHKMFRPGDGWIEVKVGTAPFWDETDFNLL